MPPRRGKKHNAAKGTTKTKDKRTRRPAEVMDASHTDSTTYQSESWYCPISTRKHFIPDKETISSRRASLRSFKRFIESEITPSSCSPQPQKKSKKLSSDTDVVPKMRQEERGKVESSIAQVDIPGFMEAEKEPLTETISKAYHVPTGSLVESPSKELRQVVVHPLTLDPEMRYEKTEKVGSSVVEENFRADIPEMIEDEVGETEKEPLTEAISAVGCSSSSPSFSLKLTEVVNMVNGEDNDDDDEAASVTPPNAIDGYQVKPEYLHILKKILSKYGDIAKNCTILTVEVRSLVLEMICGIVSELQGTTLCKIKEGFFLSKIAMVKEFKNMKVEVDWLHLKLVKMLEARKLLEQCVTLKENKESNRIVVENAKRQCDECEERIEEVAAKLQSLCNEGMIRKKILAKAMDESTKIDETIKYTLSKVKQFINCSPFDDLL